MLWISVLSPESPHPQRAIKPPVLAWQLQETPEGPLDTPLTCPLPASKWFCMSETAGPPESRWASRETCCLWGTHTKMGCEPEPKQPIHPTLYASDAHVCYLFMPGATPMLP